MIRPRPRPGILDIEPYQGGKSAVAGLARSIKLSSNESPLGPSPKAREAFIAAARNLNRYPDGGWAVLREAIAARHGLDAARIVCGNGSDEILGLLGQIYLEEGSEVIYSAHGFLLYRIIAKANGAVPVAVPERNLTTDVDAILDRVTAKTRVVFIANPNNPTGTFLDRDAMTRLKDGLPRHVLLVIDAAYAEYVHRPDYEPGIELVDGADNVVMTRTFSKIHGLALLRLGWAYAPAHVVDVVHRVRPPFNVNGAVQAAGIAAVADCDWQAQAVAHNDRWLAWLAREIAALGYEVTPSVGNFLLVHCNATAPGGAAVADEFLQRRGIILRRVDNYGLPQALRLTVGLEDENRAVVEALKGFKSD